MIYSRYETCLKWTYGYIALWEIAAVAARLVLEGLEMFKVLWSSRANKSSCILFLGRKWLLRLIYWLGIKIPERYWSWDVMWGRSNIAWLEVYNYLPNGVMVLRKTFSEPYFVGHWWHSHNSSKNYGRWCLIRQDLVFGGFLELKF